MGKVKPSMAVILKVARELNRSILRYQKESKIRWYHGLSRPFGNAFLFGVDSMKEKAKAFFEDYCKKYEIKKEDDFKSTISHKYFHTYRVVSWIEKLANELNLSSKQKDIAITTAIFHDLGRFVQFDQDHNYNNIKSGFDHAKESIKLLKEKDWYQKNHIDSKMQYIIEFAIFNHNKLQIQKGEAEEVFFAKLLRDADKLAVLEEGYITSIGKMEASKEVIMNFQKQRLVDYHLCQNALDECISEMAFVFDLNFEPSKEFVIKKDLLKKYFTTISQTSEKKTIQVLSEAIHNYFKKEGITC